MENQIKVNLWTEQLLNEVNSSSLTNFASNDKNILRMVNHQYDEIFSLLSKGKTIKVANLDLSSRTLMQTLNEIEKEDVNNKKVSIYTSSDFHKQNEILSKFVSRKDVFLTFGLLDYFEDNKMIIKSAPLVLMPIRIEYIANQSFYQISCINHEVLLNEALILKLNETRRIDLSYPLENDFSLIEFLTYVSTKVRNNHFSVNNGCFITSFNYRCVYDYQEFISRKNEISSLNLVKSISYLNAEFFNLNKNTSSRLDNHYISLLDLDNEEYKIIKRLNVRDNIFLKTNSEENKEHLLINIIYNYLLNNKKIVITYDDNKSYQSILKIIKESKLQEFSLILSTNKTSKEGLIEKLLKQDKLDFDIKLLDEDKINETVDTYYLLKNNFKKFINSLRKNNEPMNLSINRAIIEYYSLDDIPFLDIEIPNVNLIDEKKLKEYVDDINSLMNSLTNLRCNYVDHPFYGFNNLNCNQQQYLELKEKLVLLSSEFVPSNNAFNLLEEKYHLPKPNNLQEMKCILNLVSLIPDCINIDIKYFEIEDYDFVYSSLAKYNNLSNELNKIRNEIIFLYEDKVFLIDNIILTAQLKQSPLKRKIIKSYKEYFSNSVKIDEEILIQVNNILSEYYSLKAQINDIFKENEKYKDLYKEGSFDLNLFKQRVNLIKDFNNNCEFLNKRSIPYSYKKLTNFDETKVKELLLDKKKCQIAFNHLLNLTNYIEKYFDKNLVNFQTMSFANLEKKVNLASKNFSSINEYLNFYLTYRKVNKLIPSLADELLKSPSVQDYILIFLKSFYYQYAKMIMKNDTNFKDYLDENFLKSLNNYQGYNDERLEIVNALIKNNLKINLQKNALTLRSLEIPYLKNLQEQEIKTLPFNYFISQCKNLLQTMFPLIIVNSKEANYLFYNQDISFDLIVMMLNEETRTRDLLPLISRSSQQIVIDNKIINHEEENTINQNDENLICSCSHSLNVINYISSSYKMDNLKANIVDYSLKKHLVKKLMNKNLLVSTDVQTPVGTIDILVKVPSTTRPTAIILDRMNYYSLEAALNTFDYCQNKINELGFACYRIIVANYFQNEEIEFKNLINFIVENTVQEKNIQMVNKVKPLVDVLFEEYQKPEDVYYKLQDKENKSNSEVMLELLKICAPITREQLLSIFNEDGVITLTNLQMDKIVNISNGFVFLNNQRINFKRVDRNSEYSRLLNTVSNEEIQDGILKIASHKEMNIDEMIKLILRTLGMKKMNHNQYFRIENIINDLIEEKKLIVENDLLKKEGI